MHNDYPLATEKLQISHNFWSNYCSNIANKYGIKIGGVNKLVPNLGNKSKYVCHYRNLQLYLSLGMKLVTNIFKNNTTLLNLLDMFRETIHIIS